MAAQHAHFECCVSSPANIRTLAAAFQALAKHGKDVVIEGSAQSLSLRCINDSKSAFARYQFNAEFFEQMHCEDVFLSAEGQAAKVSIKSCLAVFRMLRQIERLVLSLVTMGNEHLLVFSAHCKNSVVKAHRCHFEQVVVLEADFDTETAAHRVRIQPSILVDALQHIHDINQITLECVAGLEMRLASHHPASTAIDKKSVLRTQMRIPLRDIDDFAIADPHVVLTFSLAELASVLGFCGTPGVTVDNLSLYLNAPGLPLLLTSWSVVRQSQSDVSDADQVPNLFTVKLVVATVPSVAGAEEPNPAQGEEDEAVKRARQDEQQDVAMEES